MRFPLPHNATVIALIPRIGLPALGVCLGCAPRLAQAQEFWQSCEVQVGLGGTYHYWGTTGSLVLPVSLTWSDNRYELAAFRFTDQQVLPLPGTHRDRLMADPYEPRRFRSRSRSCSSRLLSRAWGTAERDE